MSGSEQPNWRGRPPLDGWVELRVGGDRMTRVEVKADEEIEVYIEGKDA